MRDTTSIETPASSFMPSLGSTGAAESSVQAIATQVMRESDWNLECAHSRLAAMAADDEGLRDQILRIGINAMLSSVASIQREALCRPVPSGADDTRALRRWAATDYLETWIVSGKKLGDTSPAELRKNIAMRAAREKTEAQRREFESAVLKKLKPDTKRVRDVLDNDELRKIAKRVLS